MWFLKCTGGKLFAFPVIVARIHVGNQGRTTPQGSETGGHYHLQSELSLWMMRGEHDSTSEFERLTI